MPPLPVAESGSVSGFCRAEQRAQARLRLVEEREEGRVEVPEQRLRQRREHARVRIRRDRDRAAACGCVMRAMVLCAAMRGAA